MQKDHQSTIFSIIKHRINKTESLGDAVGEVLSLSQDAVYRRSRGETLLTIYELEKLCAHYEISLDALFESKDSKVIFDFQPLDNFDYTLEGYLETMAAGFKQIKSQKDAKLMLSINNTHFLQLLNFPHLVRFKLYFWARTYLNVEEYQGEQLAHKKITEAQITPGWEILRAYISIPSKELFDPEFFRGFTREILYYFNARLFKDPSYAVFLLDHLLQCVEHIKQQVAIGKKYIVKTEPPASGNEYEVYLNDTLNGITSTYYNTGEHEGFYMAHNIMNTIHTTDKGYVADSLSVLERQFANSSMISGVNEKERNNFFHKLETSIKKAKAQVELELMED
ncbi:MAG: hypothetical protein ACI865_002556 [Flavobacteriaceae bacterium]|jgi:hypothetical protein